MRKHPVGGERHGKRTGRVAFLDPAIIGRISHLPRSAVWINEARFGLRNVVPYLMTLAPGDRVLEVGSGAAIVLAHLCRFFPELETRGIEPFGEGFSTLDSYHDELDLGACEFHRCPYEEFDGPGTFEFIFLINVFEHLPDWRHFLTFVKERLTPTGVCLILCPNYGFPFESHFRVPILVNKAITYRVFKSYIDRFESSENVEGLWSSLNFVSWSKLVEACSVVGLAPGFDTSIVRQLIDRLADDPEFSARQRTLGVLASLLDRIGGLRVLEFPPMRRFLPYMKAELRHSSGI